MATLIIDTSYGSTVGIVGHEPISEQDSRTHVERLQVNIARSCSQANITPHDIDRIIVGTGPAPFTGLRAGIVTAKALAFATQATLIGQNDLMPLAVLMQAAHQHDPKLAAHLPFDTITPISDDSDTVLFTLALNDARRKQLYFMLTSATNTHEMPDIVIPMDIDYPAHIATRVQEAINNYRAQHPHIQIILDIIGHGAHKYEHDWTSLTYTESLLDVTPFDLGDYGLTLFAQVAQRSIEHDMTIPTVEPLYLRRPDVSVPNPLKHVLNHDPIHQPTHEQDHA